MVIRLELKHICGRCGGTGETGPPSKTCVTCGGAGELYWGHANAMMDEFDEVDNKLSDMDSKINSIKAEQASQREDLTVALTQIWNKVKDL